MAKPTSPEIEGRIRHAFERPDHAAAATIALDEYGPEILGFLGALLDDPGDGDEVFAMFCEDLWRGLPRFEWRCSARGWCYTLARHAAMRFLRAPAERSAHRVPLSRVPEIARVADRVRTETAVHLRTEVKSQMRRLREQLPLDDQTLLILRVDKDLSWEDVATVLASTPGPLDAEELTRETARVRKRFQLVKEKLKRMAEQAGLLLILDR